MAHVSFPKPDSLDREAGKYERRLARKKVRDSKVRKTWDAWSLTREAIYNRDKGKSRYSGTVLYLRHPDPRQVAEINHNQMRSAGGPDESWNLCTLSPDEHRMFHGTHSKYVLDIYGNADETLRFVKKSRETGQVVDERDSPNPSLTREERRTP